MVTSRIPKEIKDHPHNPARRVDRPETMATIQPDRFDVVLSHFETEALEAAFSRLADAPL
jgi:hypothetical protein